MALERRNTAFAAVGAVLTIFGLLSEGFGWPGTVDLLGYRWNLWLVAAVVAFVGGLAVDNYFLRRELLRRPRPKLEFTEPWASRVYLGFTDGTRDVRTADHLRTITVGIANRSRETECRAAVAELVFTHPEHEPLTVRGRWGENDYPVALSVPGQSPDVLRMRTLEPNGYINGIHVAYLLEPDNAFYAASHDFWVRGYGWEPFRLAESEYDVRIVVSGHGTDSVVANYRLRRVDADPPLELTPA